MSRRWRVWGGLTASARKRGKRERARGAEWNDRAQQVLPVAAAALNHGHCCSKCLFVTVSIVIDPADRCLFYNSTPRRIPQVMTTARLVLCLVTVWASCVLEARLPLLAFLCVVFYPARLARVTRSFGYLLLLLAWFDEPLLLLRLIFHASNTTRRTLAQLLLLVELPPLEGVWQALDHASALASTRLGKWSTTCCFDFAARRHRIKGWSLAACTVFTVQFHTTTTTTAPASARTRPVTPSVMSRLFVNSTAGSLSLLFFYCDDAFFFL